MKKNDPYKIVKEFDQNLYLKIIGVSSCIAINYINNYDVQLKLAVEIEKFTMETAAFLIGRTL